jgi:hypothetical protein
MGLLSKAPCGGQLSYYSDSFEDAMSNALALIGYMNETDAYKGNELMSELLDTINDDLGQHSERHATPREMGWVGQDGLP